MREALVVDECHVTVDAKDIESAREAAEALYDEMDGAFEWKDESYDNTEVTAEEVTPCKPRKGAKR